MLTIGPTPDIDASMMLTNSSNKGVNMKLSKVQKIAKSKKVEFDKKTAKLDLVRMIQRAEGNFDCFGKSELHCGQNDCMWYKDCLEKDF